MGLGHLAGDQQIYLAAMIFIIGQAFVDLSFREVRKTPRRQRIDRLSRLKKPNDIVNANSRILHSCVSAPDTGRPNDVAVGLRNRTHDRSIPWGRVMIGIRPRDLIYSGAKAIPFVTCSPAHGDR